MTNLKRRIAAKEQRLLADKAAVRDAAGVWKRGWSRRLVSPVFMAGGFALGFALGWRRPKPGVETTAEASSGRPSGLMRALVGMGTDIVVPVAISALQERLRAGMDHAADAAAAAASEEQP